MPDHPPFWKRNWIVSVDGKSATHVSGLLVKFENNCALADAGSTELLRQEMLRDLGNDWHFAGELFELTAQAEELLKQ